MSSSSSLPHLSQSSLALAKLGASLLLVSIFVGIWEILASQVPSSPLHVGLLPEPIAELRRTLWWVAVFSLLGAWLAQNVSVPKWITYVAYLGTIMLMGSLFYGAARGMMGIQILDPRPDAKLLFALRALGDALLVGGLLGFVRALFFRIPEASGGSHSSDRHPLSAGESSE